MLEPWCLESELEKEAEEGHEDDEELICCLLLSFCIVMIFLLLFWYWFVLLLLFWISSYYCCWCCYCCCSFVVLVVVAGVAHLNPCFLIFCIGFLKCFSVCFFVLKIPQNVIFTAIWEFFPVSPKALYSKSSFILSPSSSSSAASSSSFFFFFFFFFFVFLFLSSLPFPSFIFSLSLVHFQSLLKQLFFVSFSMSIYYLVVWMLVLCFFCSFKSSWSNLPCVKVILLLFVGYCLVSYFASCCWLFWENVMSCNTTFGVDIICQKYQMLVIFELSFFCFVWFGFSLFCFSWCGRYCCFLSFCCCWCVVVVVLLLLMFCCWWFLAAIVLMKWEQSYNLTQNENRRDSKSKSLIFMLC